MDVIKKDSFFDDPEATGFWNVTDFPSKDAPMDMLDTMYL